MYNEAILTVSVVSSVYRKSFKLGRRERKQRGDGCTDVETLQCVQIAGKSIRQRLEMVDWRTGVGIELASSADQLGTLMQ